MSAERLRQAAALLRERAEAATAATGQWSVSYIPEQAVPEAHIIDRWFIMDRFENGQETGPYATCEYGPTSDYIALMAPLVALALAGWLEDHAINSDYWEQELAANPDSDPMRFVAGESADRLADAILGDAS